MGLTYCIFYSYVLLLNYKKSIDFCILNETYPSRVCVDPLYSTSSESTLVINEKFFSYYGDVPFYQYNSEEAEAYSIHVVEDGNDYPTIYLSEEYFDDFVNTYFMTSGYLLGLDCGKESFKEYQGIYPNQRHRYTSMKQMQSIAR